MIAECDVRIPPERAMLSITIVYTQVFGTESQCEA